DLYDGMSYLNLNGSQTAATSGLNGYVASGNNIQEMLLETGGASAESSVAGFNSNIIPRDGGNDFNFIGFGLFTNDQLVSQNLTDELRARGLQSVNKGLNAYDTQASLGGPVARNRLWFFATTRFNGGRTQFAGLYWNKVQGTGFYQPDLSRPADRHDTLWSAGPRLTWQVSPKNKVNIFAD